LGDDKSRRRCQTAEELRGKTTMNSHSTSRTTALRTLAAICLLCVSVPAGPLHTQVAPFQNGGGTARATNLQPQQLPLIAPLAVAGTVFGYSDGDFPVNFLSVTGSTSASMSRSWTEFPGAYAAATVGNGKLGTYASTTGFPAGKNRIDANGTATFIDQLTVSSNSLAPGSLGYFNLTVELTGSITCDATLCPTGLLFGYGWGTLGRNEVIHYLGGERAIPGSFTIVEELVPLPFLNGQAFNIGLSLLTTARDLAWEGNSFNISDELHTLRITGVEITDAQGQEISSYLINSESGLGYGPNGITPAPEPGAGLLALSALGALAACRRFRRRDLSGSR
jgi:hypothetical protein